MDARCATSPEQISGPYRLAALLVTLVAAGFCSSGSAVELRATVLDGQQAAVPGAKIWVRQDQMIHHATADNNGALRFDHLAVGPADVAAWQKGYAVGGFNGFLTQDFETPLLLEPPATLTVRIVDHEFKPVPGALLKSLQVRESLFVPVEELVPHGFPLLRSNDEGVLEIPLVPQGGFVQLVVSHYRYADSSVAYLPVNGKRQDIILYPGVSLRGRVTDGVKGIPNALVTAFQEGVGGARPYAEIRTDTEGLYAARLPNGDYTVRVRHPEYASPDPKTISLLEDTEENVLDLAMMRPRIIDGKVVFTDDSPGVGIPVLFRAGKTVYAETFTGADGRFRLLAAPAEGVLNVVPPPGFMTEILPDIPVSMGEKYHARMNPIRLKELPTITGVVKEDGAAPTARVLISSLDLPTPIWTLTDDEGHFQIRLDYVPDNRKAAFRAEHARRFLRRDFHVDFTMPKPVEVRIKPFDPDLATRPPIPGRNDLHALEGKAAPKIQCADWFNSQPLSIESLKGRVAVLTFWAGFDDSPFGISRIEELRALHDLLCGTGDVVIVGIHDAGNEAGEVEEYVHRLGITFPVGRDADPFVSFVNYGVNFIPQTVLIDKRGNVRFTEVDGRLLELIKTLRRES